MAATYQQVYDVIVSEANFRHRVTVATVRAAQDIYVEDPATAGHSARAVLATKVLNAPESYTLQFALVVGTDAGVIFAGIVPSDATILAAVKAGWSAMAGA